MRMNSKQTIAAYLIDQLYQRGVRHVFGVPGDYVLGFYGELEPGQLHPNAIKLVTVQK